MTNVPFVAITAKVMTGDREKAWAPAVTLHRQALDIYRFGTILPRSLCQLNR
jgi:hypothetical protein